FFQCKMFGLDAEPIAKTLVGGAGLHIRIVAPHAELGSIDGKTQEVFFFCELFMIEDLRCRFVANDKYTAWFASAEYWTITECPISIFPCTISIHRKVNVFAINRFSVVSVAEHRADFFVLYPDFIRPFAEDVRMFAIGSKKSTEGIIIKDVQIFVPHNKSGKTGIQCC